MAIDRVGDARAGGATSAPTTSARSTSGFTDQLAMLEAERCLQCPKPLLRRRLPGPRQHPAVHQAPPRGRPAGRRRERCSTTTRCPASPAASARRRPSARACASAARRATRSPSATWSATSPTGRSAHPDELPHAGHARPASKVGDRGLRPGRPHGRGRAVEAGHEVTVFEAFHAPGGVLVYGIPEFRLPKDIVQAEVDRLVAEGVKIEIDAIIGRTYTIARAAREFDALFLAVGAGLPVFMNVPGENLKGVYSANEYLTRVNLMGAWNADSADPGPARPARRGRRRRQRRDGRGPHRAPPRRDRGDDRLPPRPRTSCPARREEVHHAEQEGVAFEFLAAPVEVLGDENALGHRPAVRADGAGRAGRVRPAPARADPGLRVHDRLRHRRRRHRDARPTRCSPAARPSSKVNEWGYIITDEYGMTSMPGVFAGGDIVRGAATVILAMGDGKRAAASIDSWLNGVWPPPVEEPAGAKPRDRANAAAG